MITNTNQYASVQQFAKDLRGHDTRFRIVSTYGDIAILEDGNHRMEYKRSNKAVNESLLIDGYNYNPTIVNKNQ